MLLNQRFAKCVNKMENPYILKSLYICRLCHRLKIKHLCILAYVIKLALTTFNLKQEIVMRDECFEVASIFFRH